MVRKSPFLIEGGPATSEFRVVLAHGAGAGIETPFMTSIADLLIERDLAVSRFEFSYMAARREGGSKRPPPRAETLTGEYIDAVKAIAGKHKRQTLIIGGKSMGGRVASLVADELYAGGDISGLVCLGYPFHPPNQPDKLRTMHLEDLYCPTLIAQGERDPFGSRDEIEALTLSSNIAFTWLGDGDHDFGPRGGKGFTRKGNLAAAANAVAAFVSGLKAAR